jgi:hypothetical protein
VRPRNTRLSYSLLMGRDSDVERFEQRICDYERLLFRQRLIVASSRGAGNDTHKAEALLSVFESLLVMARKRLLPPLYLEAGPSVVLFGNDNGQWELPHDADPPAEPEPLPTARTA